MLDEYLRKYHESIIRLAKLMVIKFSDSPRLINDHLLLKYGPEAVNAGDPTTWKYYLHLAGEYHPSDQIMTIYSLDTAEEIVFSKASLAVHTVTRLHYQALEHEYYQLVSRYPEQESLIRGILYPTDIQTAIDAEDGTILAYPTEEVEDNEVTLIGELEAWIKRYLVRWNVQAFMTSDTYYVASYQAVLYLNIVQRLYNLRNKRIHTPEVHSFHLRSYLASHGRLDRYYDYFTHKQRLFLYRNIRYIERHSGLTPVFKLLVQKMLTDRKIPLSEYTARQYEHFDGEYYPSYRYRKTPINTEYNIPSKPYYDLLELAEKESTTTQGNAEHWMYHYQGIKRKIENSGHGVMLTKDLESFVYDYSDNVPHTYPEILLSEWISATADQTFKSLVSVKNPVRSELINTTTDKALVYFMYLYRNHYDMDTTTLPTVVAYSTNKKHIPGWDGANEIAEASAWDDRYQMAEMLYQHLPSPSYFYSIQQFNIYAKKLFEARVAHWVMVSNTGDLEKRGYYQGMVHAMFCGRMFDFSTHPDINPDHLSMADWLYVNNLPVDNFSRKDRETLMTDLFKNSTGFSIDKTSVLKYIQKAMVAVMKQLSSYSVQYITETNDSSIRLVNWPTLNPGQYVGDVSQDTRHPIHICTEWHHGKIQHSIDKRLDISDTIHLDNMESRFDVYHDILLDNNHHIVLDNQHIVRLKAPYVEVSSGDLIQNLTPAEINDLRGVSSI